MGKKIQTQYLPLVLLLIMMSGCASPQPITGTAFVMDTILEYKLYGKDAQQTGRQIEQAFSDLESRVSLYRDESEISRLNEMAGKAPVAVSEDTFDLLERCKQYGEESEGTFDVTVAPLALAWGITSTSPAIPDRALVEELLSLVDYRDILLDRQNRTAMLAREGQRIDLGGIAKGYAAQMGMEIMRQNGIKQGYLSIGGNLAVIGKKTRTEDFLFGVRDPRGTANDFIATIILPRQTMATSGDYERFFEQDGKRYHHILDPATGYPANGGLFSVSVISADGAYADYLSTALFIRGRDYVLSHLDAFDCGLIVIDDEYNVYVSRSLQKQFQMSDPTGRFVYRTA